MLHRQVEIPLLQGKLHSKRERSSRVHQTIQLENSEHGTLQMLPIHSKLSDSKGKG